MQQPISTNIIEPYLNYTFTTLSYYSSWLVIKSVGKAIVILFPLSLLNLLFSAVVQSPLYASLVVNSNY